MTIYDVLVGFGCFILAGVIPGVPVIAALLVHVWWDKRKQRRQVLPSPAPAHPYRVHPSNYVWRFVKVHVDSTWPCTTCGAGLHDDCNKKNHHDETPYGVNEWPVWAT